MSTCGCVAREPLFRCLCPRYRFSQRGGREHRVQVQTRFWTPHCPHCSPREQVSVAVFREQRVPLGTCPAVVTGTVYVTAPVCSGKWVRVTAVMSEGGQVSGGPAVMCVYVLARSLAPVAGSHGPANRAMCAMFSRSSAGCDWLPLSLGSLYNSAAPPPAPPPVCSKHDHI